MSYISANLNFLITVIKKAGNALSRDFSEMEQLQSSVKGHREFVATAADRMAKTLRTELQRSKPTFAVVFGNEARPDASHFLIAPLDGVINFSHGIPYFAVSLAVVENGVVTAGVIFNPATSDLYFAEKGQGAFKEGFRSHERLRVSARKELGEALVSLDNVEAPSSVGAIRVNGSVALDMAYVASGKYDALLVKEADAASIAAGMLLVKEAGGYVYELNQKDIRSDAPAEVLASGNLIAVNAELGRKLHGLLN